jgi:hypothetical protein
MHHNTKAPERTDPPEAFEMVMLGHAYGRHAPT